MKALYVFERIFHYVAIWLFIIAGFLGAFGLFYAGLGMASKAANAVQVAGAMVFLLGMLAMVLAGVAVLAFAVSHIFKQARRLAAKRAAKKAEAEEECCCCCEEPVSDLDAQVEEVMKWKNLYVEGIITEREFIDKRNEILRISK